MAFDRVVKEFGGDETFVVKVLDDFLDEVSSQINTMGQCISNGDAEGLGKDAHSIKGAATSLAADALSLIALELEHIGRSGVIEKGAEVLERFEKEYSRLRAYARDR